MRRTAALALALVGVGFAATSAAVMSMRAPAPVSPNPVWTETAWPFAIDQWGTGRAFICRPADCGVHVKLYVRPKIGFCNCATGVSDEAELERVADTDLLAKRVRPHDAARPVKVGWMTGLSRPYGVADRQSDDVLLSIAFNDDCDVVVALADLGAGDPALFEPAILAFLNSTPVVLWAKKELGLEFVRRDW